MRHFLTLKDFTKEEILEMIDLAIAIKKEAKAKKYVPYLKDQTLGMIFEKSPPRTRVSFEAGMYQLGGHAMFLNSESTQLGRGEPIEDMAKVMSRMVDIVMIRTFEQSIVERFDGSISAQNGAEGGAVFTVRLPAGRDMQGQEDAAE